MHVATMADTARSVTPQLVPRHNWSPGPSVANYVAVDGSPDQVWLPWMVRVAASGPPPQTGSRWIKPRLYGIPTEQSDYMLVKAPCTFAAMANE